MLRSLLLFPILGFPDSESVLASRVGGDSFQHQRSPLHELPPNSSSLEASMSRLELSGLRSQLAGPFELTVPAGTFVAITGASGAGKSLFLRLIADLDPGEGEVMLDGTARSRFAPTEWRRRVTYVAAESGWWKASVADHFPGEQQGAAQAFAARLGIGTAQFAGPIERLSTGERLRLSLIRAFLISPAVLLLDEPTGALDPESTLAVEAYLRETTAEGTAILLVTHETDQIARLGARHFRMVDRKLESGG
jgi:UDP-glucose/iron transport system ATP-binding protein